MEFTQATRNLCAGCYLDSDFAQRVLHQVYADRNRHVAPSYGFDVAQVALHARRAWWIDVLEHVALVVAVLVAHSLVAAIVVGGVLLLWHAIGDLVRLIGSFMRYLRDRRSISEWMQFRVRIVVILVKLAIGAAVVFLSLVGALGYTAVSALWRGGDLGPVLDLISATTMVLLVIMAIVVGAAHLRQLAVTSVMGVEARAAPLRNRRLRYLERAQQSDTTFYAGYRPFIGSGEELDTWAFVLRLLRDTDGWSHPTDPKDGIDSDVDEPAGTTAATAHSSRARESLRELDRLDLTTADLMNKIRSELESLAEASGEARLPNLEIRDRYFVTEAYGPKFLQNECEEKNRAGTDPTGPARRYLVCTVRAWDGEVVTSVFINATLQGRMLHLELSIWALLPTRPDFHVEGISGRRAGTWHGKHILQRLRDLPEEVRRLPGTVWTAMLLAGRTLSSLGAVGPSRWGRRTGTKFSAREDSAITWYVVGVAARTPTTSLSSRHRDVLLIEEADRKTEREALEAVREAERLTRQAARAVNYFQIHDIRRHWKIIERRVVAAVLDLLEERGLDTAEYRSRVVQFINTSGSMFFGQVNAPGSHFGGQGTVANSGGNTASKQ